MKIDTLQKANEVLGEIRTIEKQIEGIKKAVGFKKFICGHEFFND